MTFHFEDFALDPDRRELRRGGLVIETEPQVFDLICHLVRERARVVTKDELLDAIWNGRIVSESTLTTRINAARRALGDSGNAQRLIRTILRKGFRFVGEVRAAVQPADKPAAPKQEITFCRSSDGVSLAISTCGDGPPVVKVGTWLTHVERDWRTPVWGPLYARVAQQFRLIHYDPRGCVELNAAEISFEGFVRDLESVVDSCRLERFSLLCFSQGAAVGAAFAARHPGRIERIVMSGGFPLGWRKRGNPAEIATREAMVTLIQHGWGQDNPAFRRIFNTRMWPDLTPEQMAAFDELQRCAATPESAARIQLVTAEIDVVGLLPQLAAPTLVIHSRDDGSIPREMGLLLAREIPAARFLELDSRNHIPMPHEPVWERYIDEMCAFLSAR
jgi:DNA-binding winged helix-turn-helix (wHTH) protein/pimeloyl-ACP methyl ester carboxylesterase